MIDTDVRALFVSVVIALGGCGTGGTTPPDGSQSMDSARSDSQTPPPDVMTGGDVVVVDTPQPPADAPPPGPGCAGRSYLFCEDFESAPVGGLPTGWTIDRGWQTETSNPAVASDQHHSGMRALHSAVGAVGQHRARFALNAALGAARGTHWGRVFYKVQAPAFMPSSGVVHNTLLGLMGAGELRVVDTVQNTAGAHQFLLNVPDDSCCAGSRYNYHSYDGAWHCAEWHVDQTARSYHFYFDGAEVTDIAYTQPASDTRVRFEAFTGVTVGWREYQNANPPYQSWLDDIAIDTNRVGCN
jgi:hypothetical protein